MLNFKSAFAPRPFSFPWSQYRLADQYPTLSFNLVTHEARFGSAFRSGARPTSRDARDVELRAVSSKPNAKIAMTAPAQQQRQTIAMTAPVSQQVSRRKGRLTGLRPLPPNIGGPGCCAGQGRTAAAHSDLRVALLGGRGAGDEP